MWAESFTCIYKVQVHSLSVDYLAFPLVKYQALQKQHLLKTALVTTHIS